MKREHVAAGVFLVLAAGLVVGQRFGFVFAGGSGYEKPLVATGYFPSDRAAGTRVFVRGETVQTEEQVFTLKLADLGYVDLQPHTELTIERFTKDEVILRMGAGTMSVTANALPFEVRMDVIETTLRGNATFNHAPERRLARISPTGPNAVTAGRRGELKTPVTEPSVLFYDRADRETIDIPAPKP